MKVEMKPQHGKGPGINIHGPHVTRLVWSLFNYSIMSNRIDCRWYQARQQAAAFFQGGSDRPDGEWLFIEFWRPDNATAYLELINMALEYVDDNGKAKEVIFRSDDEEQVRWFKGFTSFYEFNVVEEDGGFRFIPNDALAITTLVEKSFTHPDLFQIG